MNENKYSYKRNSEYIETKNRRVQLLVQPTTFGELKRIAVKKEISLNELVNCIFKEYIKKYDEEQFDLEDELRKLEITKFECGEENFYIQWDCEEQKIDINCLKILERPLCLYFTKDSIEEFLKNIENKKITKEKFFSAYEKVFGQGGTR